jgi:hypothetical protein
MISSRSVLVICREGYKRRFDERIGGAGYEGQIITGEILAAAGPKFIPVLRQGDWTTAVPTALTGVYGVDLREELEKPYQELVRRLHGDTPLRPVGPAPDWVRSKLRIPGPVPVGARNVITEPEEVKTPAEYAQQTRRLKAPDLVQKIWSMPHWRIWSRPEEFKAARFRDLEHCAQFVGVANVRSDARWSQYPWFAILEREADAIASGIEITEATVEHFERWLLFLSGQFVHTMALDHIKLLGDRTHVLEILDTTTAVFEFIGRMASRKIFTGRVAIQFELNDVAGRQLTWPADTQRMSDRVDDQAWCQDKSVRNDRFYDAKDMIDHRRELAIQVAVEIYAKFGWTNPPVDELINKQRERFGNPVHV